jgi:hypothetical protein
MALQHRATAAVITALIATTASVETLGNPPTLQHGSPNEAVAVEGDDLTFTVYRSAATAGPVGYNWRRNGVPIGHDPRIRGARGPTMTISPVLREDAGIYDVVIYLPDGRRLVTRPAAVSVGRCYADMDNSGGAGKLDFFDLIAFQTAFAMGDPIACDCDEQTGKSVCDIFDYLCFMNRFMEGCW